MVRAALLFEKPITQLGESVTHTDVCLRRKELQGEPEDLGHPGAIRAAGFSVHGVSLRRPAIIVTE
jgi:hypothetical protein